MSNKTRFFVYLLIAVFSSALFMDGIKSLFFDGNMQRSMWDLGGAFFIFQMGLYAISHFNKNQ